MNSTQLRLIAIALLAVLSMSFVPVLIKSSNANEFTIGIVRLAIALLCITPWILIKFDLKKLPRRDWIYLFVVGLVFGGHWLSYFIAIKLSTAALAALAVSTYGIHLLLLNWMLKRQSVLPLDWFAIALCVVGCLMVTPSFDLQNQLTVGMLVGIVSGFLYACLPLLHQNIVHVPTMNRAWGQFAFAFLFFLPWTGKGNWSLSTADWMGLVVLGVVCTVIGHSLWVKASAELPVVFTGVIYYLYVPIAIAMGFFFLDENVTPLMLVGATLIIGANMMIAVSTWYRFRRNSV